MTFMQTQTSICLLWVTIYIQSLWEYTKQQMCDCCNILLQYHRVLIHHTWYQNDTVFHSLTLQELCNDIFGFAWFAKRSRSTFFGYKLVSRKFPFLSPVWMELSEHTFRNQTAEKWTRIVHLGQLSYTCQHWNTCIISGSVYLAKSHELSIFCPRFPQGKIVCFVS